MGNGVAEALQFFVELLQLPGSFLQLSFNLPAFRDVDHGQAAFLPILGQSGLKLDKARLTFPVQEFEFTTLDGFPFKRLLEKCLEVGTGFIRKMEPEFLIDQAGAYDPEDGG